MFYFFVTTKTKKHSDLKEMWKHGVTEEIWCTISWPILLMEIYAILCCSACQQDILIHMFVRAINRSLVIIMFSLSPFSFLMLLEDNAQRLIRDNIKIGQGRLGTPWSIHHAYQTTGSLGTSWHYFKHSYFISKFWSHCNIWRENFRFWNRRWVYLRLKTSTNCQVV